MKPAMQPAIAAADFVGTVLARDIALIDVFVRHSPHFTKLRNPVLRRMMAGLVTVEQAAGIAGVATDVLVRDLNVAIGADPGTSTASETRATPASDPATHPPARREVELDLRDDLRHGREPFSRIMAAVGALRPDEVLHLRAIFEPVPLYTVLGKRGLRHATRAHAADDWSVWFWRDGDDLAEGADGVADASPPDECGAGEQPLEQLLDVRGLEPPEPMVRTLDALESLPAGGTLVQVNVRVPQFLLPILAERGFVADVDETQPDRVVVRIRRAADTAVTSGPQSRAASSHPPESPVNHQTSTPLELDVRVIAPREKHPTIFSTFDGLRSGESMIIINDHDPRPLRYQLAAERPDTFDWTYLEEGPETWRVQIARR